MSPKATLERGYSIVMGREAPPSGRSTSRASGDDLLAQLPDGQLVVEVLRAESRGESMTDTASPAALSYEQAREELISLCSGWSRVGFRWKSRWPCGNAGSRLAAVCQAWLDGAKAKIDAARTNDQETDRPKKIKEDIP